MTILRILSISLFILVSANAHMFQSVDKKHAVLVQKGDNKMYCQNCGMNLVKFYKTSHAIRLKDGKAIQYCSIHCLAESLEEGKLKDIEKKQVVAVDTNKFIDVKNAYYVIGSKVKGTMTMNSKYAFSSQEKAKQFISKNAGKLATFEEAYNIAKKDFVKDMGMLYKKRSTKMWTMGEKLYKKRCDKSKLNSLSAHTMGEMKAKIHTSKACGKLKDKQTQAVLLYIWDVKMGNFDKNYGNLKSVKKQKKHNHYTNINLPKKSKCPVCGMIVNKYPKWLAQITSEDKTFYFDGVKDMMKFYFEPLKYVKQKPSVKNIKVTDYYTTKLIDAKKAFFVSGSNVFGPMGNELIAFEKEEDAKVFLKDHLGKEILKFENISKKVIDSL